MQQRKRVGPVWLVPILSLAIAGFASHSPAQGWPGGADLDGDGIPDQRDKCPSEPEDHDGFGDQDGCPDPDNDLDGVLDADDKCPMLPEDSDGFSDEDGCPDPDNDQDGVPDKLDRCPRVQGPGRTEGCPPAKDAHLPLVLVYDVHDPAGIFDRKTLDQVARRLAVRFARRAGYRQVPRARLHMMLRDEQTDAYRACWDPRCQLYLGQRLAAHKVIGSRIARSGQVCTLRAELTDIGAGAVERSASVAVGCGSEALVQAAQDLADRLQGKP